MPLDGIVISAIVHELRKNILNGRIEKIYQPEHDEINIFIRCLGNNYKLLISASSNHPRLHLISTNKQNPSSPPMFCMVMRKHLQGGRIINIQQKEFERIVLFDIESYDELGNLIIKQLIIEIMGKHSNIILIDKSKNKIIDSIKRVSSAINRYRELLPGKFYIAPPSQDKKNPMKVNYETFLNLLKTSASHVPTYKAIYTSLQGISPLTAREICYRAKIDDEIPILHLANEDYKMIWHSLRDILECVFQHDYTPNIINAKDGQILDFYSTILYSYNHLYETTFYQSISEVLETFYQTKDLFERLKQKSTDLRKLTTHTLDKLYNKKQKLTEEWIDAVKSQKYRIMGELLTANMHLVRTGMSEIEVPNYYDNNEGTVIIPLDASLSPAQNAQKYFKKYTKGKNALKEIKHQLYEVDQEINYFENIIQSIENASTLEDIEEIRLELMEGGYIRKRKPDSFHKKDPSSKPLSFISSDGFQIFVGKNNKQNDALTLKFASKKDLWFHTKNIPGSHVIIVTNNIKVPETTIREAAELAAFYSKARLSSNVPVDYTEIRNVKKPKGAKPGMVIYENNKTVYITPRNDIINILNKNKSKSR